MTSVSEGRQLLPTNVKPVHYTVELEPNFTTFVTDGSVMIDLAVIKDSNTVSLHAVDIYISSAELQCYGETNTAQSATYDKHTQVCKLTFEKRMKRGSKVTLMIKFKGILNDKIIGLYRSSYKDSNGHTKYMACTQMEATDARRAFPCFDEPALKATFDIVLISDKTLTCLSNMNVISETNIEKDRKRVVFATSPLMSTYIIAFVIGDLSYIERTTSRVPIRIYAAKGLELKGQYAAEVASRTLTFYEEVFESPYPLPKMDMVGTYDFPDAMENWGLIIYKNEYLLLDENKSAARNKMLIAEIVQHELAHQWFGNLVTMDFWDGLWLNEGFATWMSFYSMNRFNPEWHIWQRYVARNAQHALRLDALRSSHPIEVPVKNVSEINQIFDAISYSKGSAVIRMISKFMGEQVFLKGVRKYLKKHAYGNTQTKDLWAALSEASGKDIGKIMGIWTMKVGFPVVSVTETAFGIHLRQNRFLQTADVTEEEDQTIYPLFISLQTSGGVQEDILFETRCMDILLPTDSLSADVFKINIGHSGFYRTLYTPSRLLKISQAMAFGAFSAEDRIGLISDTASLASSGYQKTSALLDLLYGLSSETNPHTWSCIITVLGDIHTAWKFEAKEVCAGLKRFGRQLISPLALKLGWDFQAGELVLDAHHKAEMFAAAAANEEPVILAASRSMFDSYTGGNKSPINPYIRLSVLKAAISHGTAADFLALLSIYNALPSGEEKNDALRALGATREPLSISTLLDVIMSDAVKPLTLTWPLVALRDDAVGALALWQWLSHPAQYAAILAKEPEGVLGEEVVAVTAMRGLGTAEMVVEAEKFFMGQDTRAFDQRLAQSIEEVRVRVKWATRDRADVRGWLEERGYL